MFSCALVTFPYDVLGQVWYLIESIPDICLLPYFEGMGEGDQIIWAVFVL